MNPLDELKRTRPHPPWPPEVPAPFESPQPRFARTDTSPSPVITYHISDLPPEEQERIRKMREMRPQALYKRPIKLKGGWYT